MFVTLMAIGFEVSVWGALGREVRALLQGSGPYTLKPSIRKLLDTGAPQPFKDPGQQTRHRQPGVEQVLTEPFHLSQSLRVWALGSWLWGGGGGSQIRGVKIGGSLIFENPPW